VASGQTQDNADRTSGDGICLADHPRCFHPEDLFFDDVPLRHVGSLGEVGAGKWYFDYAADKIYFADDPTGHRVETSVSRYAFQGTATGVTIRSLVIEKYANPLQQGAVSPAGANWLVEDNTIRLTHGEGMRIFDGARLLRNKALRNGQQGVGGVANGALIEGNEIAFNNFAGVNSNWAAGGVKINGRSGILTQDVTLRDNNVHDNVGMGLWCDFNCIRIAYDHNTVWNNTGWGIQQEIGYAATITNNTLTNNGGGVFVSTSQDVEVANNTITGKYAILGLQETRGTGVFGTLILANMNVHDNVVTLPSGAGDGQHVGVIQTNGDASVFSTRNNRFTANRYTLSGVQRPFAWLNAYRTATEWRSYGLDVTGTITP
jgi:parallel beta-helix repeat protein